MDGLTKIGPVKTHELIASLMRALPDACDLNAPVTDSDSTVNASSSERGAHIISDTPLQSSLQLEAHVER